MIQVLPLTLAQAAPEAGGPSAAPALPATPAVPQAAEGQPASPAPEAPRPQGSPFSGLLPIILIFVVLWIVLFLPQRREKKRRQELLAMIKKGDRVLTVGGAIGTVLEVRPNEVTLKVDENTNTRMRFSRSAIQSVLAETDAPA